MGFDLISIAVALLIYGLKVVSARYKPNPFFALSATAFMGLLIVSVMCCPPGPGQEFGPLPFLLLFYPIGFVFCFLGVVTFFRDRDLGEPIGHFRTTLLCICTVAYIAPIVWGGWLLRPKPSNVMYRMDIELRVPATLQVDPKTRSFIDIKDSHRQTCYLEERLRRNDGEFLVCWYSYVLPDHVDGSVLVVQRPDGPFQVFRPHLPNETVAADWTEWVQPDYLEVATEDDSTLLPAAEKHERTEISPDCFEMRYKIEKRTIRIGGGK